MESSSLSYLEYTEYMPGLASILASIDNSCFGVDKYSTKLWASILRTYRNYYLLLVLDKESNSYVAASLVVYEPGLVAYFYTNAVLPEYRNKGIGTTLIQRRLDLISSKVELVQTHTRVLNTQSISLLRKFKFKLNSYIPDFYGNLEDGLLWELRLGGI